MTDYAEPEACRNSRRPFQIRVRLSGIVGGRVNKKSFILDNQLDPPHFVFVLAVHLGNDVVQHDVTNPNCSNTFYPVGSKTRDFVLGRHRSAILSEWG
ncbi:hypothetical protein FBUS_01256 [Fasciolopsis buskii]|uniref:Uncharacterized protein n=1 Tax=Fasciolopsis buskii TaxID=27845 RepID=A0A8E0RMA3_9TREM|nr:hypothetical protein FBUS_01256 [Fasciolopsis buski]